MRKQEAVEEATKQGFNWVALDKNGTWCGYYSKPYIRIERGYWEFNPEDTSNYHNNRIGKYLFNTIFWEESLTFLGNNTSVEELRDKAIEKRIAELEEEIADLEYEIEELRSKLS